MAIKSIRRQMGISQRELADIIGASPSVVALAETGRRTLPDEANYTLLKIENVLEANPGIGSDFQPEITKEGQDQIDKKIRLANQQLVLKRIALEDLLEKFEKGKKLMAIAQLPDVEKIWTEGSIEKDYWNLLVRKCNFKLKQLRSEIILLKAHLAGLEAEIKMLGEPL